MSMCVVPNPEMDWKEIFHDKVLKPSEIDVLIYHGGCTDGFMSAVIAKRWFEEHQHEKDVEYIPCIHNRKFDVSILKGKKVLVCDFSFLPQVWDEIVELTQGNLLMLDHHETASRNFPVTNPNIYINQTFSGASLTWYYFYPDTSAPNCVLFVEDHDLWRHQLPLSREFSSFVYEEPFSMEAYEKLFDDNYITNVVIPQGIVIWKHNQILIQNMAKQAMPLFVEWKNRYFFVACLPCHNFISEMGDYLVHEKFPLVNFSMMYYYTKSTEETYALDTTKFSLRSSEKDGSNVEQLALPYGGGHVHSSAGSVPYLLHYQPPGSTVLNPYQLYYFLNECLYRLLFPKTKFLVINCWMVPQALVSYLMQPRSEEEKMKRQEGLYWIRSRYRMPELEETYDAAMAWVFDGNQYNITLYSEQIKEENLQRFLKENTKIRARKTKKPNVWEFCSTVGAYVFLAMLENSLF